MRKLLLSFLTLFLLSLCPLCFSGEEKHESPYVMEIRSMGGGGHGCAVNGLVLTNRHMVDPRRNLDRFTEKLPKFFFRYEWPDKTAGVGHSLEVSEVADLAIVVLDQDPPLPLQASHL